MRSRQAFVASTAESERARTLAAISDAVPSVAALPCDIFLNRSLSTKAASVAPSLIPTNEFVDQAEEIESFT